MKYLEKIQAAPADLSIVESAYQYFEKECDEALTELAVQGRKIWEVSSTLSALMAYRYGQYREIDAVIQHLEIFEDRARSEARKYYLEGYGKTLTATAAEKYVDSDDRVIPFRSIAVRMKFIKERFAGITKGLETLHYQLGHLVKLKEAGIDEATI